mmetsp:Transcript_11941/g.14430  ORF Transcript_11941/g.14430 Transcript_11941/m.14430 type:complete len:201 (-) Transcript_11941:66-668(-)
MFKLSILLTLLYSAAAFTVPSSQVRSVQRPAFAKHVVMHMSEPEGESSTSEATTAAPSPLDEIDPMELEMMDDATREQYEKAKRAQELREQEVFMQRSTGKHQCTNCDWEFDETKGDSMMIGGQIKPGTPFAELPSNWRCPVCRASKDSFQEVVEEIPGFEVNQGYGLGGNSMTAGQKNLIIFGGLGAFFALFLLGYGLS